ncbi:putative very-long-chain 3-oxoacyl-CoA reductase [Rosa chinensis]|uniref:Putative very-long-chain 3-oxoacyl-CoA reductase n=1 Tax=Rosa chinensis TaxID=74649 RepID=A0A2P6P6Y0_ROSCH|nr:putative very-long-chain 3-oxoacyl-CoA reductase [Rosa chinensis]
MGIFGKKGASRFSASSTAEQVTQGIDGTGLTAIVTAILKGISNAKIDVMELDLSSMASVRKFAEEYNSKGLPSNILIYNNYVAYAESKLANILHANELTRRLKEERVEMTANSLHHETIRTNIMHNDIHVKSATTYFLALNPQVKGVCGEYYVDCNIAKPSSQAVRQMMQIWPRDSGILA